MLSPAPPPFLARIRVNIGFKLNYQISRWHVKSPPPFLAKKSPLTWKQRYDFKRDQFKG